MRACQFDQIQSCQMEQLTEETSSSGIHSSWLKINENGSKNITSSCSFMKYTVMHSSKSFVSLPIASKANRKAEHPRYLYHFDNVLNRQKLFNNNSFYINKIASIVQTYLFLDLHFQVIVYLVLFRSNVDLTRLVVDDGLMDQSQKPGC